MVLHSIVYGGTRGRFEGSCLTRHDDASCAVPPLANASVMAGRGTLALVSPKAGVAHWSSGTRMRTVLPRLIAGGKI